MIPLPDIDASLREIEYAFDTLHADGAALVTSYGPQWLGDKAFEPVFDELNRRRAVVYCHRVEAACCHAAQPNTGPQAIEYPTDTSRAIWSLINDLPPNAPNGSAATRYSNIQFIWSHGGGSLLVPACRHPSSSPGK